jgi:hypothetical protein
MPGEPESRFRAPEIPHAHPGAENREMDEVLHELGGVLPGSASFDWQESQGWCGDVLRRIIARSDRSRRLRELLANAPFFVGGDEHHVFRVPSEPNRVFKLTHGDNFGCRSYFSPHDPELTGRHFHGTGDADPFFYLRRWRLLNLIGGYQTRFEGFVPAEKSGWLPRICISQPELEGTNPPRSDIRKAMLPYGFSEISDDAYLDFDSAFS